MADDEDREYYDYIVSNCCSQCGEVWECDGPDNPLPGGVCEVDDGDFDDDDGGDYE